MNANLRLLITHVTPLRFFTLTFILSWLIWIPLVLSHFGIVFNIPDSTSALVRLFGVLMPAAAAIFLAAKSGEKGAVGRLLSRLTQWRFGVELWAAAVLVYPILLIISTLIFNSFGEPNVLFLPQKISSLIVNFVLLLIAVLGEEIGWHGIALPALQQKHTPKVSSLILGFFCGVWHLPFWLLLDTFDQFGVLYLALNFIFIFPTVFYITWFFNKSQYSLLLAVVFHFTFNIINSVLLPVTLNIYAFGILICVCMIIMILVLPHLSPKNS